MEKNIEMLEKRLGRKVDANFLRECKKAYFDSRDTEEFRLLTDLPVELIKATLRRQNEED